MSSESKLNIRENLEALSKDVDKYLAAAHEAIPKNELDPYDHISTDFYWKKLPAELQETANQLVNKLLPSCGKIADLVRSSALTGPEDLQDVKIATKKMKSALQLRRYHYHQPDAIHDEGVVLGFRPAEQFENGGLTPNLAASEYFQNLRTLRGVLKLIEAGSPIILNTTSSASGEPAKYRTGTAFIMMWMDPKQPELTDVADVVRSVFLTFGIKAVRADDIEHEGLITQRILDEIRTSEFLFADLTGMRPNVYYEVGFAHALNKRVILYRKAGTGIHFDLAGYNCPEYENLRDLR